MTATLDRAVANAMGFKSVNNCEKWSKTMTEEDDDTQVYKKPWVGLTELERAEICDLKWWDWEDSFDIDGFARAIEAKLREKNNG
jgi:hypothetical protein